MKLIIAGSRNITNISVVKTALAKFKINLQEVSEIVSGMANGVDKLGERIAEENNIPVKQFPADWRKYDKSAGYKRNIEMAEYGDMLLVIWDGNSKGSKAMFDLMRRVKKPAYLYIVKLKGTSHV
jgi:hypothetical protein